MGNNEDKVKIMNNLTVQLVLFSVPDVDGYNFLEKIFPSENFDLERYYYNSNSDKFRVILENSKVGATEFDLKIFKPNAGAKSKHSEYIEKADAIIFMIDVTDALSYFLASKKIKYYKKLHDIKKFDITFLGNNWEGSSKEKIRTDLVEKFAIENGIKYIFASNKEDIKNYLINKVVFYEKKNIESQMDELNKKRKGWKKEESEEGSSGGCC